MDTSRLKPHEVAAINRVHLANALPPLPHNTYALTTADLDNLVNDLWAHDDDTKADLRTRILEFLTLTPRP